MSTPIHEHRTYGFADARKSFKSILDASDRGGLSIVQRGDSSASVVNTALLKAFLMKNTPANVQVVNEDGAWAMFIPGLPLAAEGSTVDEATHDLIDALREYAEDWEDHLRLAPNHKDNWALVQIVDSSTDGELAAWLNGTAK
ncbi:putative RNase H-like HicB family nuclease [Arthrobacter pigmenti]|uniref:Putative RNase H-like HicB family nuclease n=1 Tax=Arthrobacter pigmenti TaxID=271432 RepID=A0A846RL82_9MICC|nr:prevent-host-death protein [Arthrobacter pigmenti]NJC21034.1 putative RNase H-like HicB family nuclease [Arthrobacter pigmenti]